MIVVLIITFNHWYIVKKQLNINKEAVKAQQKTAKATAAAKFGGGGILLTPEIAAIFFKYENQERYLTVMCRKLFRKNIHNIQQFISILKGTFPWINWPSLVSYLPPPVSKKRNINNT